MNNEYKNKRREFLRKAVNYSGKYVKPIVREGVSIGVLGGGLAYLISQHSGFLEAVKEGTYHARHIYRTGNEVVRGSEGMNSVDKLEDALKIVVAASKENKEARLFLEGYIKERISLVESLSKEYHENETLAREADRLAVQIKGMAINYTAAGDGAANAVTGGVFRKIDDFFMNLAGSAKEARDGLPKLQEFYKEVRKFYDGREKHEHNVKELCDYLREKGMESQAKNENLNKHLDTMIKQLDKTYKTEEHVFNIDDKVSFYKAIIERQKDQLNQEDIEFARKKVAEYKEGVNGTERSIRQDIPIGPFNDRNWVDNAINPVSLGIAGALITKGLIKLFAPRKLYEGVTSLSLMPIIAPYLGARKAINLIKKGKTDKLKKEGDSL